MKRLELIGQVFGKLTVTKFIGVKSIGLSNQKKSLWEAICECGNITIVIGGRLTNGTTKSCGCYKKTHNTSHGMSYNKFYKLYNSMIARINNPTALSYENYGGRGVIIEWKTFEEFKDDMYESYLEHQVNFGAKNTTLERVDNDGNYSKENCKWATRAEQGRNRRSNVLITFNGKTQCLQDWADEMDINRMTLRYRLKNWSIERALCKKVL